jgi:hypothetical protein
MKTFDSARKRNHRRRPARSAAGTVLALAAVGTLHPLAPPAAAQNDVRPLNAGQWSARDGEIRLELAQSLFARTQSLRVLAAGFDITALARTPQPGQLVFDTRPAALPPGAAELVIYLVEDGAWREISRTPLKLLTRGGFENAQFTPKLDLAAKSQFAETSTGTTSAPARPHFADLTGRGSAGFILERNGWTLDGQFNGAGSSYRPEALRFGERGSKADKFDLADYRVGTTVGATRLSFGHLSTGSNPLLLDGFASRGVGLAQRFGDRFELSFNAMNGTGIVGTDNFFGLDEAEHRVLSGGAGVELFERAGALRADLLYMDASVQSRGNFNVGEIPDAETSHGIGLRLAGATESNRLRGEALFARSTYVNPFDPQLAQGGSSQAVKPATANGVTGEVNLDLLRDAPLPWVNAPLTLTASTRHERVAPLFRSLGASIGADRRANRAGLGAQIAGAQVQLTRLRAEDNLDNIPSLLQTRTSTTAWSANLPLPQWLNAGSTRSAWPALSYQRQFVHQRALNAPAVEDSGVAATHRPDQISRQQQLSFNWTRDMLSWGYSVSQSHQDNRQVGRERADFASLSHQLTSSWRAGETLNLVFGVQRNRNTSREKELVTYADTANAGFDWTLRDRWTLASNISRGLGNDSRALATNANRAAQAQLGYRFDLRSFGHKMPGQAFVRYSDQASSSQDTSFGIVTRGGHRAWNAGLSLSLF